MSHSTRSALLFIAAPIFALFAGAGCSANPEPKSSASAATNTSAQQQDAVRRAAANDSSQTGTAVSIDDAILKACGIRADKAFFAFDSARLRPGDSTPLDEVAKCFKTGPLNGRSLSLVGHADPRGESEYNMVLGQSRADTVGSFFNRKGIEHNRVSTTSRGALDAKGTEDRGWAGDRRVDVLLGS